MARILFRLANVPEIEANAVKSALEQAGVDFYETSAGRWGLSLAALWARTESDFERGREVIDECQQHLDQLPHEPTASLGQRLRERPLELLLTVLAVLGVLTISLMPFLNAFASH
ncbi:DUF6164 family protein [Parathalassolituus penaei]|uniref:DUF6164 family protein n=1 Tax=Parathalassolituus penaei TaxID=2997323 RepID=A0A9X3EEA4_9GAMM|nr:DUF6164 family protein [Parathalassolituus penaei]MCY0966003.1 DUF6164 family protein [Parathalassolituus penaei]